MPTVHLTDLSVKALKPTDSYVKYWSDTTPGFGIRVGKRSRMWTVMRGRTRERVSIGRYPDVSLSDARKEAQRLLTRESSGPRAISKSFKAARDEFLADHYRDSRSRWPHLVGLMLKRNFKKIEHMQLNDITDDDISGAPDRRAPPRSDPFVHRLMCACIGASFELAAPARPAVYQQCRNSRPRGRSTRKKCQQPTRPTCRD